MALQTEDEIQLQGPIKEPSSLESPSQTLPLTLSWLLTLIHVVRAGRPSSVEWQFISNSLLSSKLRLLRGKWTLHYTILKISIIAIFTIRIGSNEDASPSDPEAPSLPEVMPFWTTRGIADPIYKNIASLDNTAIQSWIPKLLLTLLYVRVRHWKRPCHWHCLGGSSWQTRRWSVFLFSVVSKMAPECRPLRCFTHTLIQM
jgi:hypothetical protein